VAASISTSLHYGFPLIFCLAGFHGIFFYSNLWKKTGSWCAFQAGLILFLIQLAPLGGSFPLVLALLTAASTLGVGGFLALLCMKISKRFKTTEGGEIGKKVLK
jgi:hypothetical protein